MNRIHVLSDRRGAKVLKMGRLNSVCHKCTWNDSRMINPKNSREIDEIKRLMRVAHAGTGCPEEPRIIRASS